MVLDFGLSDNSAVLAREILKRGTSNLEYVLKKFVVVTILYM